MPPFTFLLTRLLRGVTTSGSRAFTAGRFLLTRLLRGVTVPIVRIARQLNISTHTPLARRDLNEWYQCTLLTLFLLTRLLRGVT